MKENKFSGRFLEESKGIVNSTHFYSSKMSTNCTHSLNDFIILSSHIHNKTKSNNEVDS